MPCGNCVFTFSKKIQSRYYFVMAPKRKQSGIETNLTIRKNPVRASKAKNDITVIQTVKEVKGRTLSNSNCQLRINHFSTL